MLCKYLFSSFGLLYHLASTFLFLVFIWMSCLLARVRCWSHSQSVCEDELPVFRLPVLIPQWHPQPCSRSSEWAYLLSLPAIPRDLTDAQGKPRFPPSYGSFQYPSLLAYPYSLVNLNTRNKFYQEPLVAIPSRDSQLALATRKTTGITLS